MNKRAKFRWGPVLLFPLLFLLGIVVVKTWQAGRRMELNRALITAVEQDDTAKVIALLSQGANPNARDIPADGRSVWQQFWDRLRGQSPTIPTGYQPTVLERAIPVEGEASQENPVLIKTLLDAGANANVADENGNNTPLMKAAVVTHLETARLLLESGAQINAHDKWGMTALHFAALTNCGDPDRTSSLVDLLISRGGLVNARDIFGRTPLHITALHGNVAAARLLLAHGAEVDAQEKDGSTPLAEAAMSADADMIKLLLAKGTRVNLRDNVGRTPLKRVQMFGTSIPFDLLKQAGGTQ